MRNRAGPASAEPELSLKSALSRADSLPVLESSVARFDGSLKCGSGILTGARARVAAALGGIVAVGVVLRFGTLGLQSYHHDEVITAARVLPGSLGHMLHEVRVSESTPPLYYLLAHWWSQAFGLHEVGLRSLSALFGVATIPVAYLVGSELHSRRAGLITGATVALNPMLIWYSQEARSYALLVLLTAVSLWLLLRALRTCRGTDLALWAIASGLALCTHYFAAGVVAIEAAWLIFAFGFDLVVLASITIVALTGLALAPLALAQVNPHHIGWISSSALGKRLVQSAASFAVGETGQIIAQRPRDVFALPLAVVAVAGLVLGMATRRGAIAIGKGLAIAIGSVALAVGAALAGHDYVIGRNLLPALVPLSAAVGAGLAASRHRQFATGLAALFCISLLAFDLHVAASPNLQRPDWRRLARDLGPARRGRALVSWKLGAVPLRYYLRGGDWIHSGAAMVGEVDVVGRPAIVRRAPRLPGFRLAEQVRVGRLATVRYIAAKPRLLPFGRLESMPTGFGANAVILQGVAKLPRTFAAVGQ